MLGRLILAVTFLMFAGYVAWASDVSGKWKAQFQTPKGPVNYTYEFQVDGDKLTGKSTNDYQLDSELTEGKVDGSEIKFVETLDVNGGELRIVYKGTVEGDTIHLTREVVNFATEKADAHRVK